MVHVDGGPKRAVGWHASPVREDRQEGGGRGEEKRGGREEGGGRKEEGGGKRGEGGVRMRGKLKAGEGGFSW